MARKASRTPSRAQASSSPPPPLLPRKAPRRRLLLTPQSTKLSSGLSEAPELQGLPEVLEGARSQISEALSHIPPIPPKQVIPRVTAPQVAPASPTSSTSSLSSLPLSSPASPAPPAPATPPEPSASPASAASQMPQSRGTKRKATAEADRPQAQSIIYNVSNTGNMYFIYR